MCFSFKLYSICEKRCSMSFSHCVCAVHESFPFRFQLYFIFLSHFVLCVSINSYRKKNFVSQRVCWHTMGTNQSRCKALTPFTRTPNLCIVSKSFPLSLSPSLTLSQWHFFWEVLTVTYNATSNRNHAKTAKKRRPTESNIANSQSFPT